MDSNGSRKPVSLSSKPLYGQNPTLSFNSLVEIVPSVKKQRTDCPVKGQMGPQKQNKKVVSQNLRKIESCKKLRKDDDKSSDSFVPWSPLPNRREWQMATQAYIAGKSKSSTPNEKAPIAKGCSRQNDSGEANGMNVVQNSRDGPSVSSSTKTIELVRNNDMNVVENSPVSPNFDSSTQIMELDLQGTLEHPKGQLKRVSLCVPKEVVNNLDSSTRRIESESIKSKENAEKILPILVEDNEYPNKEGGVEFPELDPNFKNFKVVVNGVNIDCDLGDDIRAKYFNLCYSQGSYLHKGILKIVDDKMACVIISKVTEISEWTRKCNISSNLIDFEERRAMLQGFETFGMNLGFLIARLNNIYEVVLESTVKVDLDTCKTAKTELLTCEGKKKSLKSKLLEVEKEMMRLQEIVQNATKYEAMIRKEANAPW